MSLVAYDSSDGSGEESEEDVPPQPDLSLPSSNISATGERSLNTKHSSSKKDSDEPPTTVSVKNGLFSMLPAPKRSTVTSEDISELPIPRTPGKRETVKITIPSLKEFKDEDEEEEKTKAKRNPSKVGSGLIGLLPDPQNITIKETAKQLIPHSVSRKAIIPKPEHNKPAVSNKKPVAEATKAVSSSPNLQDGNDSDEETVTDFFSLSGSKEPELPLADLPSELKSNTTFDIRLQNHEPQALSTGYATSIHPEPCSTSNIYYPVTESSNVHYNMTANTSYDNAYNPSETYEGSSLQQYDYNVPAQEPNISVLKDEAIFRLAGKKRSAQESIEFVDVNGDDLVAGREEWLLKSLSETNSYQPAPKRSDQPSAMHRRKHQITYLAFQAKAREQELKNQWSMNRMTKKQTQSKYGF